MYNLTIPIEKHKCAIIRLVFTLNTLQIAKCVHTCLNNRMSWLRISENLKLIRQFDRRQSLIKLDFFLSLLCFRKLGEVNIKDANIKNKLNFNSSNEQH